MLFKIGSTILSNFLSTFSKKFIILHSFFYHNLQEGENAGLPVGINPFNTIISNFPILLIDFYTYKLSVQLFGCHTGCTTATITVKYDMYYAADDSLQREVA